MYEIDLSKPISCSQEAIDNVAKLKEAVEGMKSVKSVDAFDEDGAAPAATKSFAAPAVESISGSHRKPLAPKTPESQERLIERGMLTL